MTGCRFFSEKMLTFVAIKLTQKMKRIFITTCCLLAVVTLVAAATPRKKTTVTHNKPYQILVISDIHLLAPQLYDKGEAAQKLAQNDLKLVLQSDEIMQATVDWAIKQKPSLVLITGDLTFNGEQASHHRLATHLARLAQGGVPTLVIPGNHDVSNPNSRQYIGSKATPAPTITRDEFAQVYSPYGYGNSSRRDPASLSYACEPIPGLVVLGIDSNRDEENRLVARGDTVNKYHSGGRIKPETLQWLRQQAQQATAQGKRVIAMMHHHLIEHIDGEAKYLKDYIVDDHDQVAQTLASCGIHAVFTGHLHITDAVTSGTLTEVATGSLSTYPMPMRVVTIDRALDSLRVDTQFASFGPSEQLLHQGREQIERNVPTEAKVLARKIWPRLQDKYNQLMSFLHANGTDVSHVPSGPDEAATLLVNNMRQPLTQIMLTITRGGEDPQQAMALIATVREGMVSMACDAFPAQLADDMAHMLVENLMPRIEPTMRSALEDRNQVGKPNESSTPDHRLTIQL